MGTLSFGGGPLAAATYYVATNGLDSNNGSLSTPWATISHAAITMGAGDTAFIRGGTYRETVYIYKSGSSGKPIAFQAYPGEVPVISGADIFTNWTWDTSATPYAWSIPWTNDLASTTNTKFASANLTALRPEMVIFNGQVLWAVDTRSALTNGAFFVNGPSTNPTAIYALFPSNAPPTGNTVEIATRNHALQDTASYTVINGLTFRYACNICQDLMVQVTGQNNAFENNAVEWANAGGLYSAGSYNVFSNNLVRCNGQMGFSGAGSHQLWVTNQSIGNNWKLYNPGWEAGGGKWVYTSFSTFRGHQAIGNNGPGIWFDVTNYNNLVERCYVCSNSVAGIQLELLAWRFTVQNNVICDTQLFPTYASKYASGITMLDACSNNIVNNTIYGCAADGIFLYSDTRVNHFSGHNNLFNNIIAFNSQAVSGSLGNGYQIYVSGQTPAEALSNTLDGNAYWRSSSPGSTFSFLASGTSNSGTDNLATWQSWTGDDASSVQQDPLLFNSSLATGFYLTTDSPARGLGVTPPVTVTNDFLGNPRPVVGADAGAVQYIPPPGFSETPLPLRRFIGGNAVFSATVTGGPPVSLQWYLNSTPIAGATNSTLQLTNLTSAQAGNYSLVASNVSAVATSLPAQLSVWSPGPYATAVLADAPAAYWRLDETNGPTVFDCLSTNNGTASAAVVFGAVGAFPDDLDTACHFDASNSDKVDVDFHPALNSSAFSFECWARVTGGGNSTASPLTSRNAPVTQGYCFQVSSNNVWQFCSGTGINNLWHTLNGPAVTPGRWTHLVGTYSGTSKTFYVNGLAAASATVQFAPNTDAPLRLGAGATEGAGNDFFNGDVDEVAVYGYALSAARVQTHYQTAYPSETLGVAPTSGGLQLTWSGGTLQAAASLNGPWTVVTNAVPPWFLVPATNRQFFRVRIP
ncbi:MAG TPA: LamG-like jellyroll fold domain-containing protein [Candidatus Acidoferrum sp.]|nr:LamG-like jellyroll fold domain-containing protein [Candidatus Acidoferrum sp.]